MRWSFPSFMGDCNKAVTTGDAPFTMWASAVTSPSAVSMVKSCESFAPRDFSHNSAMPSSMDTLRRMGWMGGSVNEPEASAKHDIESRRKLTSGPKAQPYLMPCVHKGNGTAALAVHLSFVVLLRETDPGFSTSAFLCYARPRTDQPFNWVERTLTSFNWAQNCALNIRDQHSLSTHGAGAPIKSVQVKLLQVLQRVGTSQQSPEKLRLCHFANSHRSGPSCKDWLSCLINYFQAQRRARKRVEHWISCGHWTYWTNSWFNWDLVSSSNRIPVS